MERTNKHKEKELVNLRIVRDLEREKEHWSVKKTLPEKKKKTKESAPISISLTRLSKKYKPTKMKSFKHDHISRNNLTQNIEVKNTHKIISIKNKDCEYNISAGVNNTIKHNLPIQPAPIRNKLRNPLKRSTFKMHKDDKISLTKEQLLQKTVANKQSQTDSITTTLSDEEMKSNLHINKQNIGQNADKISSTKEQLLQKTVENNRSQTDSITTTLSDEEMKSNLHTNKQNIGQNADKIYSNKEQLLQRTVENKQSQKDSITTTLSDEEMKSNLHINKQNIGQNADKISSTKEQLLQKIVENNRSQTDSITTTLSDEEMKSNLHTNKQNIGQNADKIYSNKEQLLQKTVENKQSQTDSKTTTLSDEEMKSNLHINKQNIGQNADKIYSTKEQLLQKTVENKRSQTDSITTTLSDEEMKSNLHTNKQNIGQNADKIYSTKEQLLQKTVENKQSHTDSIITTLSDEEMKSNLHINKQNIGQNDDTKTNIISFDLTENYDGDNKLISGNNNIIECESDSALNKNTIHKIISTSSEYKNAFSVIVKYLNMFFTCYNNNNNDRDVTLSKILQIVENSISLSIGNVQEHSKNEVVNKRKRIDDENNSLENNSTERKRHTNENICLQNSSIEIIRPIITSACLNKEKNTPDNVISDKQQQQLSSLQQGSESQSLQTCGLAQNNIQNERNVSHNNYLSTTKYSQFGKNPRVNRKSNSDNKKQEPLQNTFGQERNNVNQLQPMPGLRQMRFDRTHVNNQPIEHRYLQQYPHISQHTMQPYLSNGWQQQPRFNNMQQQHQNFMHYQPY